MKKTTKIALNLLVVALLFILSACSGIFGDNTRTFTFSFDSSPSVRSVSDTDTVTLVITLSGGYSDTQSKTGTLTSLKGSKFTFTKIPTNTTFDITVQIYSGSSVDDLNLVYEGSQTGISLSKGSNAVSIAMSELLNTPIMYYSYDSAEQIYTVWSEKDTSTTYFSDSTNFCFDADGNYYIPSPGNSSLYSNNSSFESPDFSDLWVDSSPYITVDLSTNIFYASLNNGESDFTLYKYPSLISESSISDGVSYSLSASSEEDSYCFPEGGAFVVYNNVLYAYSVKDSNTTSYSICIFDLSTGLYSGNSYSVECDTFIDLDLDLSDNTTITDMLYQDGSVYILVRDIETESSSLYSRGAVVKVNLSNNKVSTLGLTTDNISSEGSFYAYAKDENDDAGYCRMYSDSAAKTPVLYDNTSALVSVSIYAPDSSLTGDTLTFSAECFYGPIKFIALKPKKLVIADDGFAFYTNSDGAYSYKNVNRIVTVDLESFAIDTANETSAAFESDGTDLFCIDPCDSDNFFAACFENYSYSTPCTYYANSTEYTTSSGSMYYAVGIPLF